jgi:hypothetical protein
MEVQEACMNRWANKLIRFTSQATPKTLSTTFRELHTQNLRHLAVVKIHEQQLALSLSMHQSWHQAIPVYRMKVTSLGATLWRWRAANFTVSVYGFASVMSFPWRTPAYIVSYFYSIRYALRNPLSHLRRLRDYFGRPAIVKWIKTCYRLAYNIITRITGNYYAGVPQGNHYTLLSPRITAENGAGSDWTVYAQPLFIPASFIVRELNRVTKYSFFMWRNSPHRA